MSSSISTNATRVSLLARAIERDQEAWRQLVDLYGPLVATWCRSYHLDSHSIADILQDVFMAVSRSIGQFRSVPGDGAFRSWLWKITRNKLIDRLKTLQAAQGVGGSTAQHRMTSILDPNSVSEEEPSDLSAINALMSRGLRQIQAEFRPTTWAAFWRSAIDGIPSGIVADELGITSSGVRQARNRVLRRLREYMNGIGPG